MAHKHEISDTLPPGHLPGPRRRARLAGDTAREATSDEVKEIQAQARQLKELVAELMIENRLLKKSVLGDGESDT